MEANKTQAAIIAHFLKFTKRSVFLKKQTKQISAWALTSCLTEQVLPHLKIPAQVSGS